ncbi:MAG: hypothetical protein AMXMBFR56_43790 [Polyangiaceae bacterium]
MQGAVGRGSAVSEGRRAGAEGGRRAPPLVPPRSRSPRAARHSRAARCSLRSRPRSRGAGAGSGSSGGGRTEELRHALEERHELLGGLGRRFDPHGAARGAFDPERVELPLRRAILKQVQDPLAESLLGNKYAEGTSIKVGLDGERFTFTG